MGEFFRNALPTSGWVVMAIIPPVILALYYLKLRRQPLEVPSTYLWQKSLEDLHVNSLWQKLRKSLLLLLQLLLVCLIALALLRPGWKGTRLEGQQIIFLIDNSASMMATDIQGSENRLAKTKKHVAALIDQLESGMTAMLISFSDKALVVQEHSANRRVLKERLESIQPTYASTDLREALTLAASLVNSERITREDETGTTRDTVVLTPQATPVYIFSDGRFEDVKDFSLGNLVPKYIPIGTYEAPNIAITQFTTQQSDEQPDLRQAFIRIGNYGELPQKITVEIEFDGTLIDAQEIELQADESKAVIFNIDNAREGSLLAKITTENGAIKDSLALDNQAYTPLNDIKTNRTLFVTPGNNAVEAVLRTRRAKRMAQVEIVDPSFLTTDEYRQNASTGVYDLVIFDRCLPVATKADKPALMPRANTLFIGTTPPLASWNSYEPQASDNKEKNGTEDSPKDPSKETKLTTEDLPSILDWNRAHPMLLHVELGTISILESLILPKPPGGLVLIESTTGPIGVIAPRESYQDMVLGFTIVGKDGYPNTNWARRHSFPTFWLNVLDYLSQRTQDASNFQFKPDESVDIKIASDRTKITVLDPHSKATELVRTRNGIFQFHDTHFPGIYLIQEDGQTTQRFAVNLFDPKESNVRLRRSNNNNSELDPKSTITIGFEDFQEASNQKEARQEIWQPIVLAAILLLFFEWYIYNRRVYI